MGTMLFAKSKDNIYILHPTDKKIILVLNMGGEIFIALRYFPIIFLAFYNMPS